MLSELGDYEAARAVGGGGSGVGDGGVSDLSGSGDGGVSWALRASSSDLGMYRWKTSSKSCNT